MELYRNEDNTAYAVLYTPLSGALWSCGDNITLACDKRIVDFWLNHHNNETFMNDFKHNIEGFARRKAERYFAGIFGKYNIPCLEGFPDIKLGWVEFGEWWEIDHSEIEEWITHTASGYGFCFLKDGTQLGIECEAIQITLNDLTEEKRRQILEVYGKDKWNGTVVAIA